MAAGPTVGTSVGNWENLGTPNKAIGSAAESSADTLRQRIDVTDFLNEARERFRIAADASNKQRIEALTDLKFRCGQQWDEAIELKRQQQGRPCLTINRIPGFLKIVLNNLRQANPEIKIDPIGDGADEEVAEIRQGLIRHIWLNSRGAIAGETAFDNLATYGLGYVRIVDAWAEGTFDRKELFVQWLPNSFTVYEDPAAIKPDWSDGKYKFIVEDVSLEEFKRRFGKDRIASSLSSFQSIGDHQPMWIPGGRIRIAEYFHIEEDEDLWCELRDGSCAYLSELEDGADVVRTRPRKKPKVVWTLMNGIEILKERTWPGKYIPVIPFIGNQIELDGERILVGMVRFARESQRMFNYMYSCFVEACALAPRAPFIAEFDQIEEFKELWERANTDPMSYLPYRMKSGDNQLVPPPQRQQAEPPVQAFVQGLKLADENLKATFSIYEASLGQRGPQESGIAINSRKIESDTATYDWIDNYHRGLEFLGLVLDDLLQHYYNDPGTIIHILREDGTRKPTLFNQSHLVNGEEKIYDLSKGKFGVVVSSGPSVETRRQESVKGMVEVAKVWPQLLQAAGPQFIRAQDWPGKDVIADQVEKMQPPELRAHPDDGNGPSRDQLQQQSSQLQQMVQQLSKLLSEATDSHKLQQEKEEWATLREQMRQETTIAVADINRGMKEATFLNQKLFEEFERLRIRLEGDVLATPQQQPSATTPPAASQAAPQPGPQAAAPPASAGIPTGG